MKSFLKKVVASVAVVLALAVGYLAPTAYAADCNVVNAGISQGADCTKPTNAPSQLFGANSIFVTVTNILLFIIGAIAVIMLIIGGIRYVVSAGDQTAVTSAKNTILYAIIGIIVAFLAYAAVNFISSQLTAGTTTTYKASTSHEA